MFSDALGLQELMLEHLENLEGLALRQLPPTAALASLLPPASTLVQLTHTADLAGAAVFAVLDSLDGAFHVCSAPLALQELFDLLARRRGWDRLVLPEPRGAHAAVAYFTAEALERAGYRLMHASLLAAGGGQARGILCASGEEQEREELEADEAGAGGSSRGAEQTGEVELD